MSKKKDRLRPKFCCGKCGVTWISLDMRCMLCGKTGKPMNDGAEKLLNKTRGEENEDLRLAGENRQAAESRLA